MERKTILILAGIAVGVLVIGVIIGSTVSGAAWYNYFTLKETK